MKITLSILTIIITFFLSCKPKATGAVQQASTKEKTDSFFPVTSFLKGQMHVLDSLPITPLQCVTINGKTDSTWIKKEDLRSLLQPFFTPEITATNLTEFFKEVAFHDQSIPAFTFTYDIAKKLPDTLTLTHWDIYVSPETGKVSKIYLVKNIRENDKKYIQQLTWQTDKWAKIVTIPIDTNGKTGIIKEDKFIWSF